MFEMVLVLGAVLLITGLAARNYGRSNEERQAMTATRQVRLIAESINARYEGIPTYESLSAGLLAATAPAGALSYDAGTQGFRMPWGATLRVLPYPLDGVVNSGYETQVAGASAGVCSSMVSILVREFYEVAVDGNILKSGGGDVPAPELVARFCAGNRGHVLAFRGA